MIHVNYEIDLRVFTPEHGILSTKDDRLATHMLLDALTAPIGAEVVIRTGFCKPYIAARHPEVIRALARDGDIRILAPRADIAAAWVATLERFERE